MKYYNFIISIMLTVVNKISTMIYYYITISYKYKIYDRVKKNLIKPNKIIIINS
jgi:hypothetical protein